MNKKTIIKTYQDVMTTKDNNPDVQEYKNNRLLAGMDVNTYIILLRKEPEDTSPDAKLIEKDKYDYIIKYNEKKNIIYGKPLLLTDEFYSRIDYSVIKNRIVGVFELDADEYKDVENVDFAFWPKEIEGILPESVHGKYITLTIPKYIRDIEKEGFKNVYVKDLYIPMHLLCQIQKAGITLDNDYVVNMINTHRFGIGAIAEQIKRNCVRYKDVLEKEENIVVYRDKIEIERSGKTLEFLPGFRWNRFYESRENMVMSLLLARYHILTISNIESAMVDIYYYNQ